MYLGFQISIFRVSNLSIQGFGFMYLGFRFTYL